MVNTKGDWGYYSTQKKHKKALVKGQSTPEELKESPRSWLYLLVVGNFWFLNWIKQTSEFDWTNGAIKKLFFYYE